MSKNIWDVLGAAGESAVKAAVANQNAQNTLKSQVMLYKIKKKFEDEAKSGERKEKFAMDLALKKEEAKAGYEAFDEWRGRNPGGAPGAAQTVTMGPTGKPTVVPPRRAIEQKVMTSGVESLNPNEKQIWDTIRKNETVIPNPEMTKKLMGNIKTKEDLKEFLDNANEYRKANVDVAEVVRNFYTSDIAQGDEEVGSKMKSVWNWISKLWSD